MESTEHKPAPYMLIWVVLFVLTAFEVWASTWPLNKTVIAVALVLMAVWKAGLVGLYYMHLRFEPKRMWILVLSPLPLGAILVLLVIQEFPHWSIGM